MREPRQVLRTCIALLRGELQASNAFGIGWLGVRDDFRNWLTWACGPRNAMKISVSE